MQSDEVNVENHPVVESDEDTFIFSRYHLRVNGEYCSCPFAETGMDRRHFSEFIDAFDAEADSRIDRHGSDSDTVGVLEEMEDMVNFSHVAGGMLTETAAKKIVRQMMHLDSQNKPTERQKDAAAQACAVAEELGWDGIIPDIDNRYWY